MFVPRPLVLERYFGGYGSVMAQQQVPRTE
jgi:hypothetical protein